MSADWKSLALAEATTQNVDIDIVLATIDAETGGDNKLGDSGNALGYGQVWPQWHMKNFQYAADRLNISLPVTREGLTKLTLSNNQFSMIVAVKTIKDYWLSANKDWRSFTLGYVGPGIPESDYKRREQIWLRYHNNSASNNIISGNTQSNQGTGYNFDVNVPATTYKVDENSVFKGNTLFGRRYRVIVSNKDGSNALDVSQLRCTFKVTKTMMMQPNYSEVTIYNLNAETENSIINEGDRIVIEAGYEGEQYGLIFDGDVLQPIRDKEDGVTYKLTLISLDSDRFFNFDFASYSLTRGQTSRSQIEQLANRAKYPIQLGSISDSLNDAKLTRGKVIFGLSRDYLRQLSQSQAANYYMEDRKINVIKATDLPKDEIIELSPSSGLIGVPAQSEFGVSGKCFLNPRIKPNTFIHIDNSLVRAKRYELGQVQRSLDADGIYRVTTVTYIGDTRGDDWYCEFDSISQAGGTLPNMIQTYTQNPW